MISLTLLSLLGTPDNLSLPAKTKEILAQAGYSLASGPPPEGSYMYKHGSLPATIQVSISGGVTNKTAGDLSMFDQTSARPSRSPQDSRMASGVKFGAGRAGHRWNPGDFGDDVIVSGFRTQCRIQLRYKILKDNGRPVASAAPAGDKAFFEGLARWTFANLEGSACDRVATTIEGRSYQAFKDAKGLLHIPTSAYTKNKGLALSVNREAGRAAFTTSRGGVVLVLGAPTVKVGGAWHSIQTVVMASGAEILLPVEVLDLLE